MLRQFVSIFKVLLYSSLSVFWFSGGWTYTGKALNLAYNQLFTAAKGARVNVAKVSVKLALD